MKGNHFATTLILLFIYFLQIILAQTEHESAQPPVTTREAFEIVQNLNQSRTVKLYWTSSNASNASQNYQFLIELFISETFVSNFSTENMSFTLSDLSLDRCEFKIYSQSPFGGISKNHSSIIVPHQRLISSVATNIIVQKILGTNSYEIIWDYFLNNHYVNCTVFWISEQSKSGLSWKCTTDNRTLVSLADGDPNIYRFGVAVNFGDYSTGIVWSHCDTQLPIDELANVRAIKGDDAHSIVLSWEFHWESQAQLVDQFMLTCCNMDFCEFANRTWQMELKNQSHVHEFVIRYLGSNNTYYFELSSPFIRKKYALYVHIPVFSYPAPPPPDQFEIFYKSNQSSPILEWKFTSEYTNYFVLKIFKVDNALLRYSRNISLDYCDFMALKCVYDFSNSKIFFKPFTQYRFVAYSCTKFDDCSSGTVHSYLTPMTAPGKITVVFLEKISDIKYRVNVQKPAEPNGPISSYHILQNNLELQNENIIFSGNQNYTEVEVKCSPRNVNNSKNHSKGEEFEISIAASNRVDNYTELIGPYSDPLKIELCIEFNDPKSNLLTKSDIKTSILPIILIPILSGISILIILSFVAYKSFIRYKVRKESLVIKVQCNICDDPDQKVSKSTENIEITSDCNSIAESVPRNIEKSADNLIQQNKPNNNFY